jgi:toxin YoeB
MDEDRAILRRLNRLLADTLRHPYEGIGKPERLKHALAGTWSRRVTGEHRLVYLVDGEDVIVLQARYHY